MTEGHLLVPTDKYQETMSAFRRYSPEAIAYSYNLPDFEIGFAYISKEDWLGQFGTLEKLANRENYIQMLRYDYNHSRKMGKDQAYLDELDRHAVIIRDAPLEKFTAYARGVITAAMDELHPYYDPATAAHLARPIIARLNGWEPRARVIHPLEKNLTLLDLQSKEITNRKNSALDTASEIVWNGAVLNHIL